MRNRASVENQSGGRELRQTGLAVAKDAKK